jgi:hypothetical protein
MNLDESGALWDATWQSQLSNYNFEGGPTYSAHRPLIGPLNNDLCTTHIGPRVENLERRFPLPSGGPGEHSELGPRCRLVRRYQKDLNKSARPIPKGLFSCNTVIYFLAHPRAAHFSLVFKKVIYSITNYTKLLICKDFYAIPHKILPVIIFGNFPKCITAKKPNLKIR